MHGEALAWVKRFLPEHPGDVLDVGGRDINGSPRHLFPDATTYYVVDLVDGPNVDLVADITAGGLIDFADTVLCLEVLEHAQNWADIVTACADACRTGGTVIVTCAGPGRGPHSASDGGPLQDGEWYQNVTTEDLFDAMWLAGLDTITDSLGPDTRAVGRKR